jgi:F-type H+-transporting ATPase subunit epsilon
MDKTLQLDIVTPDKLVLSKQVEYVGVHGSEGDFGVLPGHVPLLSALAIGALYYTIDGKKKGAFVSGGFAEVSGGKVTILAESAELAEHIDLERAMEARTRAEKRLALQGQGAGDVDADRAHAALVRAINRLNVHSNLSA